MRILGDKYVMSEFRAHRNVDNPVHIVGFLSEWQSYAQQVEGDSWRGEKMDKSKIDKMSGEFCSCLALGRAFHIGRRCGVEVLMMLEREQISRSGSYTSL
jgi:hypothetical protein